MNSREIAGSRFDVTQATKVGLVLTLGHNSSAILVVDGQVVIGYEEERLTGKKSDSTFPAQAIRTILHRVPETSITDIYIGHWFLDHCLPNQSNKYLDVQFLVDHFPTATICSLNYDFTHHDSHFRSAVAFAGSDFEPHYHALVVDGFGSSAECTSVYEVVKDEYRLVNRWFGFHNSMGLMYQYATSYLGMTMHSHEYKMLGYEVHVHKLSYDIKRLDTLVNKWANIVLQTMLTGDIVNDTDPVVSVEALVNVQKQFHQLFDSVLESMGAVDASIHDKRCLISYFVQHALEFIMLTIVKMYGCQNLLLSGGVFYNVKLNNVLAQEIPGKTCIMPLAGDQGAGLGVYDQYENDLVWPDHVFWGDRYLAFQPEDERMVMCENMEEAMPLIRHELATTGFVNVVRGAMEFGPRALCHTSTLAKPTIDVAATINRMNNRTNEMPFALVVSKAQADDLFVGCDAIHKSLQYMICARDFKPGKQMDCLGGAHYYPDREVYTCRPQITTDPYILELVEAFGPLINTSFNFHGQPIVMVPDQIRYAHAMQRETAPDLNFKTVIVKD